MQEEFFKFSYIVVMTYTNIIEQIVEMLLNTKTFSNPGEKRDSKDKNSFSYSVAFKHPKKKDLLWVDTEKQDPLEASKYVKELIKLHGAHLEGYEEHGISKIHTHSEGDYCSWCDGYNIQPQLKSDLVTNPYFKPYLYKDKKEE